MNVIVATVSGTFSVDVEADEVAPWEGELEPPPVLRLNLPRVVAAAASGATVIALVDAKPPLLVSYDTGSTWREAGRGLPPGRSIAISEENPDVIVYAARNRLYVSRNGGVFWTALAIELPEIERVAWAGS